MTWGELKVGGVTTRETHTLQRAIDATSGVQTITINGQDTWPSIVGTTAAEVNARQDDLLGLLGKMVPIVFERKSEHNGYYWITAVDTTKLYWVGEARAGGWNLTADLIGPDNAVDIESKLATPIRVNDFSLTGSRWHAPPIGHYAYFTGTATPSGTVVRTGENGAHTVYLGVPTVNPRWGCPVTSFEAGRVRLFSGSVERFGANINIDPATWTLNNGLLRVTPLSSGGQLLIESHDGSQWEGKQWHIAKGGATTSLGTFDAVTVLRSDPETIILRAMRNASPGRTLVDMTLRRGSRLLEVYIQTSTSATLGAFLNTNEASTNGTGVNTATANDAAGNKAVSGSARAYTANANGGLSKAAATTMDLWLGSVVGGTGAVAGDTANDLRDQYIGTPGESTGAGRR
jgi:hypothetical protein